MVKIILQNIDFDSPTLDGEIVLAPKELFESKTPYILENVLERLERIKKYEEWLVEAGGFEVSLNVEGYDEAVKKIEEKKEEIDGWVRENKERERMEKVESFMKIVFVGEVVKQTTDEILEKARAILGEKVNEPESISLLEKIREIGAEAGDREFWMAKFLEVLR